MKKQYKAPVSKVAEFEEETMIATSDPNPGLIPEENTGDMDSKKRGIDFSDEESIW